MSNIINFNDRKPALASNSIEKLAAVDFEPITQFRGKDAEAKLNKNLRRFCMIARVAFLVVSKTKAELTDIADDDTVRKAMLALFDDAKESTSSLLEIFTAAENRMAAAHADALIKRHRHRGAL
jgi:hypothetical protein